MTGNDQPGPKGRVPLLALGAIGVVFGDIGTSPLYAIRESFSGHFGVEPTPANILGVLSLVTWALVVIVTLKYVLLVLRADHDGEGGILALVALISTGARATRLAQGGRRLVLLSIGLFGAALLYGDGVLTPAISVLSAVEGLEVTAPAIGNFVVPITVAILVALFLFQSRGTRRVGMIFGPITLLWFAVLAVLGIQGIRLAPQVLSSLNPLLGAHFLVDNAPFGFLVLGAVFLVVTGAEALYADLGHFGRGPIRFGWLVVVLPSLLLNYLGQGALLLVNPEAVRSPFYLLAPEWSRLGLVVLATAATIIASQAVITGVFSLATQAARLGYWPRLETRHTSPTEYGQVYVPRVNWSLMVVTVLVVVGFGSSAALAAAYGLAIVLTMIVTTLLLFVVAPDRWHWPRPVAYAALGAFLLVELAFLGANAAKIGDGGWFPLALGLGLFGLVVTWRNGRQRLGDRIRQRLEPLDTFLKSPEVAQAIRVPGTAVYMTGNPDATPPALLTNLEHQKTIHARVIVLSVVIERVPFVPRADRLDVDNLPHGFHRAWLHYGYMQTPDVLPALFRLQERGLEIRMEDTTFFVGRERAVAPATHSLLDRWRVGVFSFLARNSQRATQFFGLPPGRVVEVGSQVEI